MKLFRKLFYFGFPTILCSSCDPTECPLLCCSNNDICTTFETGCSRSACKMEYCSARCCVNGRCGTETECNAINLENKNYLTLAILVAFCAFICVLLFIY